MLRRRRARTRHGMGVAGTMRGRHRGHRFYLAHPPRRVAVSMNRILRTVHHAIARRLYPGGRPSSIARALNRVAARHHARGVLTDRASATLIVAGRRTGRTIAVAVAVAEVSGDDYLVSMLGETADWVRNVRAAHGRAVLVRHRQRRQVRLREVPVDERAPILQSYLDVAPGARPHLGVDRSEPLESFARIAGDFPVFLVCPDAE